MADSELMKDWRIILLLLSFFLCGCGPGIMVTGEWINPDRPGGTEYEKLLITAMVANEATRRSLEDAMSAQLSGTGIESSRSYEIFPASFSDSSLHNREVMLERIRQTENDAIVTISLLAEETESRYVPGNVHTYRPLNSYGWYGSFWGYYDYYYPRLYEPGYYTTTKVYFIETNLYDVESGRLIWSLQTETYDPNRLEALATDLAEKIVSEMRNENLLKPKIE